MAKKNAKPSPAHKTTYLTGLAEAAAHRNLQKLYEDLLKPFELTKNQWLIIGLCMEAGRKGVVISKLARQTGCTLPYLTNTINALESRRILARKSDSKDSRYKNVSLRLGYVPTARKIEKTLLKGLNQSAYSKASGRDLAAYMRVITNLQQIWN